MNAKPEDQAAMRQALARVVREAEALEVATDTATIRRQLSAVRYAAMNAYALANAIEDHTRSAALRELEREHA